ncbi:MAG: 30S ribosomal protein S8e [Thermoplasmatota archaeon]
MSLWQGESVRKPSGGRRILARHKRRFEVAPEDVHTFMGEHTQKILRTRGAHQKVKLLVTNRIMVMDQKTGRAKAAVLKTVTENPANIHYVRRNIITRGAVVDTDLGKVKVTSRPGQSGVLSGVLVK